MNHLGIIKICRSGIPAALLLALLLGLIAITLLYSGQTSWYFWAVGYLWVLGGASVLLGFGVLAMVYLRR